MRVVVVGAGVVGTIFGWALSSSGHHVVHLVRSGRAAALHEGLAVDLFDRRKGHKRNFRGLYKLNAVESLPHAETFELIIVPVKHYSLAQTLEKISPEAGTAEFLLLTQNWRGTSEIDTILPRSRYVYADAKAGGTFSGVGLVATLSAIDIGSPEGEPSALAKKAASLFASSDIKSTLHADMLRYLWVQYAITCGLWAALIHAGNFEALLTDGNAGRAAFKAAGECLEVVKRRGVVLARYPEAAPFLTNSALRRQIYLWVMAWMLRHGEYTKRCSAHAFGDPVEVKTFYDDLILSARELGVSTPLMNSYAEDIRRLADHVHDNHRVNVGRPL